MKSEVPGWQNPAFWETSSQLYLICICHFCRGWSFIVPGLIIIAAGLLIFFFLVVGKYCSFPHVFDRETYVVSNFCRKLMWSSVTTLTMFSTKFIRPFRLTR